MFQVKNAIKFNTIFNILSYQRGIDFVDTTRSTGMYFPFQDWFDDERTAVDCLNSGCEGRRKKNCSFYFRSKGGGAPCFGRRTILFLVKFESSVLRKLVA